MEKIKEFFQMINNFLQPVLSKITGFFGKDWNIIYAGIFLVILLLALIGLIRALIKFPKTFIFILILIAAFCVASYFLIYKGNAAVLLNQVINLLK